MTTPYQFAHDAYAAPLQHAFAHLSDGEESGEIRRVAGRLMLMRRQGKLAFATMRDSTGEGEASLPERRRTYIQK